MESVASVPTIGQLTLGVDIGQKVDPTAICLVETEERNGETHFMVRHLERLDLGTAYPLVTKRLEAIVSGIRRRLLDQRIAYENAIGRWEAHGDPMNDADIRMFVDATGVGLPVCDVLAAAGVPVTPTYFTHGDRRTEEIGQVRLGKAWLVSRLKTLAQTNRLHLPTTNDAEAMKRELMDYEIRVDENANDRYGAFKVGSHDDMVTAVGLAVQVDRRRVWADYDNGGFAQFLREAGVA